MTEQDTPRVLTRGEREEVLSLRATKGWGPKKLSSALGIPVDRIKFWISSAKWAGKKADANLSYRLKFQDWESWKASKLRTSWLKWASELGIDRARVPTRPEIDAWLRLQAAVCPYCEVALTPKTYTIDHLIPLARGGRVEFDNLSPACKRCNDTKGEMTAAEFRQLRAMVLTWEDKGKNVLARLRSGVLGRRFGGKR